jgi:hypothetical protein
MDGVKERRLAIASLATVVASWVLLWLFIKSGTNNHPNMWWIEAGAFLAIFSSPVALLLAFAGLFLDRKKPAAVVAFFLSLVSTLVILSIGG